MIELQRDRMSKAIAKSRKIRNHVRMVAWRKYEVRTPENHIYTATFEAQAGKKFASCTCPANANNQMCYHIAGAVVLHLAIARFRADEDKTAQKAIEQKPVEQKRSGRKARPVLIKKECNHADCKTSRCEKGRSYEGIAI
jgi:hypothetical protein